MMKPDVSFLRRLADSLGNPNVAQELNGIARERGVLAIISQAITDNFDKEEGGEGAWAPLKGSTLASTVPKGMLKIAQTRVADEMGATKIDKKTGRLKIDKKSLKGDMAEFHARTGAELVRMEAIARRPDVVAQGAEPGRKILQDTGLLKRTATTPGYSGSSRDPKTGKVESGSNIYRVEGTNIIYGTNLVYASTHNQGDPERGIPRRQFLVIRPEWMQDIYEYFVRRAVEILKTHTSGNA